MLSVDGGGSWSFFGDAGISFFCLAIDPAAPQTMWAGNLFGFGIARSTDGGQTWSSAVGNLPLIEFAGDTFAPAVRAVVVDPAGSAVTIATQELGIFRSTDGGTTWIAQNAGLGELDIQSLAFLPGSDTLLAGGNGGGVYRGEAGAGSFANSSLRSERGARRRRRRASRNAGDGLRGRVRRRLRHRGRRGVVAARERRPAARAGDGPRPPIRRQRPAGRQRDPLRRDPRRRAVGLDRRRRRPGAPRGSGLDDDHLASIAIAPSNEPDDVRRAPITRTTAESPARLPFDRRRRRHGSRPASTPAVSRSKGSTVDPDDASHVAAVSPGATGLLRKRQRRHELADRHAGDRLRRHPHCSTTGRGNVILARRDQRRVPLDERRRDLDAPRGRDLRHRSSTCSPIRSMTPVLYAAASPALPGGTGGVFR